MGMIKRVSLFLLALPVVICLIACGSVQKEDGQVEILEGSQIQNSGQIPETQTIENGEEDVGAFDLENGIVRLNSGYDMPVAGLGTYALSHDECVVSVAALFENGGRLIDTASFYGTEESVGEAVRDSNVPREEIFVTTKLYPNQFSNAEEAIEQALETLDMEYIDLMLLHHPGTGDVESYKALEQAVRDGKIRSIGLSNIRIR